jgi:hypothetical protein
MDRVKYNHNKVLFNHINNINGMLIWKKVKCNNNNYIKNNKKKKQKLEQKWQKISIVLNDFFYFNLIL